jgi:hypothetical protein
MSAPQLPKKPEAAQPKGISIVSIRTIGRENSDSEDRGRSGRSVRKREPLKTSFRKRVDGVELRPKPSDDPRDPLVCLCRY